MQDHDDGGGGVYKVGTKYYKKKGKDKEASLPTVSVNGVRIVSQEQIKSILQQLGISLN